MVCGHCGFAIYLSMSLYSLIILRKPGVTMLCCVSFGPYQVTCKYYYTCISVN